MSGIRYARIVGHDQVTARIGYADRGSTPVALALTLDGKRVNELKSALDRALNCQPEASKWLFELADALESQNG